MFTKPNKLQKKLLDLSPFPVSSKQSIADIRAEKIAKDILGTCYGRLLHRDQVGFDQKTHRPIYFDEAYFKALITEIKEALKREYHRVYEYYYGTTVSRVILNTPILPHKSSIKEEATRHAQLVITELLKIAKVYNVDYGNLKLVIDRLRMSALDKEYVAIMRKFRYGMKGLKNEDEVAYF